MFEDNSLKKGGSPHFLEFLKEQRCSKLFGLFDKIQKSLHIDSMSIT